MFSIVSVIIHQNYHNSNGNFKINYLEESFGLTELYFKPIDREEEDMKRIRPTQGRPVVRRAPVRNVTDGTSTELTNEEESFDENQEAVDTTITDELALDTAGVTATVEQAVIKKTKKGDKKNKEVKEEKTKEAKSLLFLIIPVVLILGAGGAYYFTQKHQSKAAEEEIVLNETVNTTGEASVVSGLVETTTAETTSTDNNSIVSEEIHHISEFDNSHSSSTTVETEHEVASSKVSTSQASSGKSYIIAGAFTQERKAKKFAATISNAQILQDGDKYRVAIGEYSTKEQAKQAIEGFKAQYGEGIWVLEN